jgi:dihydroorotate dehydrogenase (fumarate)
MSFFNHKYPYMNAACSVAKSIYDVKALAATGVSAIVVGSITPLPRDGNAEPRWYVGDGFALNAFGMPNGGTEFYEQTLGDMITIAHDSGKKLILNVAGFSTQDYVDLATLGSAHRVDAIELNFGCPNVRDDGVQEPIVSFDQTKMNTNIDEVLKVVDQTPVIVKVSPYTNPGELKSVAALLATKNIMAVTTMNTFPNAYYEESDAPVIGPNGGFGGFSGDALLPIALGQVKQFRAALPEHIEVWGAGGVSSPEAAKLMYSAGASAVQSATLIVSQGHSAIDRLQITS